jgi:hypothetical protein
VPAWSAGHPAEPRLAGADFFFVKIKKKKQKGRTHQDRPRLAGTSPKSLLTALNYLN